MVLNANIRLKQFLRDARSNLTGCFPKKGRKQIQSAIRLRSEMDTAYLPGYPILEPEST